MEANSVIPRDLFFAFPDQIWNLIWLLFFAAIILYAAYRRSVNRGRLVASPLQPWVFSGRDPYLMGFRYFAFFLAWILAVFALMEPLGNESYPKAAPGTTKESKAPVELFLLVDVSQSMGVQDVRPSLSRLKKAVEVADALVKELPLDPISLTAFTSKATPVVPLTYDGIFVRLMLRDLALNQGDATGTLIGNALLDLKKDGLSLYPKEPKAVILFSDGGDNLAEESPKGKSEILKVASELKVPIFTVGIGSVEGGIVPDVLHGGKQVTSRLEEGLLKEIANASGGKYLSASEFSAADIASIIAQNLKPYRLKVPEAGLLQFSKAIYKPYFQVPLGLALALFLIFAFLPYGKKGMALFPFILFTSLYSQDTGESLYDSGHYQEAADWYSGELKSLPVPWLRDKLFYDLGVSLAAKKEWEDAARSFFMVSEDAYTYPLFRLRLVYSRLLALLEQKDPELLQEGLFMLQILDPPLDSPLHDLKRTFQMELAKSLEEPHEEDKLKMLESKIGALQFAASLPNKNPDILPALEVIFHEYKQAKEEIERGKLWEGVLSLIQMKGKLAKDPADFLQDAIAQLSPSDPLQAQDSVFQEGKEFYPLVNKWQKIQFENGVCLCEPWKEALPLFTEGLQMQRASFSESQMPFTYDKWSEALRLIKSPPSGGKSQEEEKESQEQLQELQGMQDLDRQFQKPPKPKEGEGMKW